MEPRATREQRPLFRLAGTHRAGRCAPRRHGVEVESGPAETTATFALGRRSATSATPTAACSSSSRTSEARWTLDPPRERWVARVDGAWPAGHAERSRRCTRTRRCSTRTRSGSGSTGGRTPMGVRRPGGRELPLRHAVVDGDRAAVDWWACDHARDGAIETVAGTSLLRFGLDGRGRRAARCLGERARDGSSSRTGPPSHRATMSGREALPRHHVRLPDERSRLRADQGHARVARTRRGARAPSEADVARLQHLHDPREARHTPGGVPRRGSGAKARAAPTW